MALTIIKFTLKSTSRASIREKLVKKFLKEQPGSGKGNLSSKYHYVVEKFKNYKIVLHRPAALNKGFDFVVHVDGIMFKKIKRHSNPSHNDIFKALEEVKKNNAQQYSNVKQELSNLFDLNPASFNNISNLTFTDGNNNQQSIVLILLALKWLFIEQDVTYWNWTGRNMLWDKLAGRGLV